MIKKKLHHPNVERDLNGATDNDGLRPARNFVCGFGLIVCFLP